LYDGDTRKRRYCTTREVKRTAKIRYERHTISLLLTTCKGGFTLADTLLHSSGSSAAQAFFGYRVPADTSKYLYLLSTNTISLIYNNDSSDIRLAALALLQSDE
jgi:hypothetical protein